ncbi:hypothetical protein BGZ60DRAFT_523111 [Tricladium varicosporioides]|nr:hypothetical protein BGZ60DRAFT_523111 [Hymenoscyphus varicosporioides]
MQSLESRGYTKGSRFAQSRLRLSTSCTECHRRKQKCDQKQPCKNCARRYPPPPCIYPKGSLESSSFQRKSNNTSLGTVVFHEDRNASGFEKTILVEHLQPVNTPREEVCNENKITKLGQFRKELEEQSKSGQLVQKNVKAEGSESPVGTLDNTEDIWTYQQLITSMVLQMQGAPNHGKNADDFTVYDKSNWQNRDSEDLSLKHYSDYLKTGGLPSRFSINIVEPLHYLPIAATTNNGKLLHLFLKVIVRYPISIDGNPSPNYYNDHWVPWSMKSPILANIAIHTASCYQAEASKISAAQSPIAIRHKLKSIEILNEILKSNDNQRATCDEAIAAVVYFITNEWYWGSLATVQAHLRGLREMVRLRGGIDGVSNLFLQQMVILCDYHIACSTESEPFFVHHITNATIHQMSMSTPLLPSQQPFSAQTAIPFLSSDTAEILDDMRFLILSTAKFQDIEVMEGQQAKLVTTAMWIKDRIEALPSIAETNPPSTSDYVFRSCRIASLIYCKAIIEHLPFSQACTPHDLQMLWPCMWKVTLTQWKQIPGIFLWILLSANQAAQNLPHGRLVKSIFKACSFNIASQNWLVIDEALSNFVKLQRWLKTLNIANIEENQHKTRVR